MSGNGRTRNRVWAWWQYCLVAILLVAAPASTRLLWAEHIPRVVSLAAASPLLEIKIMVKSGSAADPQGKEGLSAITAKMILEGGYGDASNPTMKEKIAEMTRPWGDGAKPRVLADKEVTTFSMTVPESVLDTFIRTVLSPMFLKPLFLQAELDRLREEQLLQVSSVIRYEEIEALGLAAIDHYVHDGTGYAHLPEGSVQGLKAIGRADLEAFYRAHYQPGSLVIGISSAKKEWSDKLTAALKSLPAAEGAPKTEVGAPAPVKGRYLVVVSVPNADSTGIHAAFPISVTRTDPDYWPLYVANVYFGTHRDSFSHLYEEIRQKRGYNYGDYSYIEHFEGRPIFLFPPFNTPRRYQYFSIWVRPVAHQYAHHLLKTITYELQQFISSGLNAEQVELSKNKAKVLYLNLAETVGRILAARLDDQFYRQEPGYLDAYLQKIDAVTPEQVNNAIRKHLQVDNIKYLVVTDDSEATRLADSIGAGKPAPGKNPREYQLETTEKEGKKLFLVSEDWLDILRKDAAWESYPLNIARDHIRIVPVEKLFETGVFIAP
jgi:zinc protease